MMILVALVAITAGLVVDRGEAKCGVPIKPLATPQELPELDSGPKPLTFPDQAPSMAKDALASSPWMALIVKDGKPVCDGVFVEDPQVDDAEEPVFIVLALAHCIDSSALDKYQILSNNDEKEGVINPASGGVKIEAMYPKTSQESSTPFAKLPEKKVPLFKKKQLANQDPRNANRLPQTLFSTESAFVVLKLAKALPYDKVRPICLFTSYNSKRIWALFGWKPAHDGLDLGVVQAPTYFGSGNCVQTIWATFLCTPYYTYGKSGSAVVSQVPGDTQIVAKLVALTSVKKPEEFGDAQGGIAYVNSDARKIISLIGKLTPGKQKMRTNKAFFRESANKLGPIKNEPKAARAAPVRAKL